MEGSVMYDVRWYLVREGILADLPDWLTNNTPRWSDHRPDVVPMNSK
jgi:hypothetical protein